MKHIEVREFTSPEVELPVRLSAAEPFNDQNGSNFCIRTTPTDPADLIKAETDIINAITPKEPSIHETREPSAFKRNVVGGIAVVGLTLVFGMAGRSDVDDARRNATPVVPAKTTYR